MDLHTIDMDRAEARKLYLEYRDEVKARHDAELAEIRDGYKALADGHQLIDLPATIAAGGHLDQSRPTWTWDATTQKSTTVQITVGMPRLAVARADRPWCWVEVMRNGSCRFRTTRQIDGRTGEASIVTVPAATMPEHGGDHTYEAKAMIPLVPPRLRPNRTCVGYHVLWEAEWELVPPRDPALLKHIGGDLYAVLGTWDLTDLERTVLARRFR